jgi:hypothetical protein
MVLFASATFVPIFVLSNALSRVEKKRRRSSGPSGEAATMYVVVDQMKMEGYMPQFNACTPLNAKTYKGTYHNFCRCTPMIDRK